jgi:hypothetical protein
MIGSKMEAGLKGWMKLAIGTKKQLTRKTAGYTFKKAIHRGQIALCDFVRPFVISRIIILS